ncbi:hypothetical protein V8E53_010458 [Lactarius tabidus]
MCACCWADFAAADGSECGDSVNRQLHVLVLVSHRYSTLFFSRSRSYYVYKPTLPTNARNGARQGCQQAAHLFGLYVPCRSQRRRRDILHPLSPAEPTQYNCHNHSQPLHRTLPLVLHLPDDQEATRLAQHGALQLSIHALALRPSAKDAAAADGRDPAARTPRAVGNAHRTPADDGPRPLPRLVSVALPALAIAYTLVVAFMRIVAAYDAYDVLVVYGRGLGGDRGACECEYPGTCR